ncbi:unnamed protein product [Brachionus calyciflorus]|uniref:Myeloid leukemia factor n=1 Tax=Brachionus calyciflorus TaxID=104777 RepID=A0A813MP27_9BILA|nr:unnamed protein product [Brachionus calyciflorus]
MFGFNDPFNHMNSIMSQFMMDPFAPPGQQQQQQQRRQNNQISRRDPFDPFSSLVSHHSPFPMMGMMGNFDNVFRNLEQMSSDPNSQVFSSSSVISYSNTGDGRPRVYQQSKQIKQGPGGVKETREMLRDSEKGIEKVAIGHHIGNRAHIIERQKNNGEIEEIVNMENLDEDELNAFNEEFESKVSSHLRSSHRDFNQHRSHRHLNNNQPLAIEENKTKKERKSKSKSRF